MKIVKGIERYYYQYLIFFKNVTTLSSRWNLWKWSYRSKRYKKKSLSNYPFDICLMAVIVHLELGLCCSLWTLDFRFLRTSLSLDLLRIFGSCHHTGDVQQWLVKLYSVITVKLVKCSAVFPTSILYFLNRKKI